MRVQLVDVFSRALRGTAEEAFRNERTAATAVVRDAHFETSGFKNFHGGRSDLRAVVVRERVVEQENIGDGVTLAFGDAAECSRTPCGQPTSAIDAEKALIHGSNDAQVTGEVRESGDSTAPFGNLMGGAEHASPERCTVPGPVIREELALESRYVDADRTLGFTGAAFETEVKYAVDAFVAESRLA